MSSLKARRLTASPIDSSSAPRAAHPRARLAPAERSTLVAQSRAGAWLRVRREMRDLVEDERAAGGRFEPAGLASPAREGVALIAETAPPPAHRPGATRRRSDEVARRRVSDVDECARASLPAPD